MSYIIRNHSEELFEQQKAEFQRVADYLKSEISGKYDSAADS